MNQSLVKLVAIAATAIALQSHTASAAIFGNDTSGTARPVVADGTVYTDGMTPTSTLSWFTFRVEPNQSYSIELWSPFGAFGDGQNAVVLSVFEADATTLVATVGRSFDNPSPQVDAGISQGDRQTFISTGAQR